MGRSLKVGLDYFRLDVNLDDKFELIEAEFGLTGFAVVVRLYQRIYGGAGYYCEWDDEVALVFGSRNKLGANVVSEIVKAAIKRKLFDRNLFDKYHILTSAGIQKWYFEAVSRREQVEVIREYLLIPADILPKNVNINPISVNINPISAYRNPHSIVEDSKEDEEEEYARAREAEIESDPGWIEFVKAYEQNIGMIPNDGYALDECGAFYDALGSDVIIEAVKATALSHAYNPRKYFQTTCREWVSRGVTTVEQAQAIIAEHERRSGGGGQYAAGSEDHEPRRISKSTRYV